MKLSQSDLIKLGLGGAAGYIGAKMLLPSRGFASKGCGNPNTCYIGERGIGTISCCHIPEEYVDHCQGPCQLNQGPNDPWRQTNTWIAGHEMNKEQRYPQGVAHDAERDIVAGAPNIGGGGGNDIGNILGGIPGTVFGIATPIVIVGGLVALIILTRK